MRAIGPNTRRILEDVPACEAIAFVEFVLEPMGVSSNFNISVPPEDNRSDARLRVDDLPDLKQEVLLELEQQAARVVQLGDGLGADALETIVRQSATDPVRVEFDQQLDDLCRSCWAVRHPSAIFLDAESFYHVRKDRERNLVYSCFALDIERDLPMSVSEADHVALTKRLAEILNLGVAPRISSIDLEANDKYPASTMLIIRHGAALSSVIEHQDDGSRRAHYYRPQDEIKLMYSPGSRRIEVLGVRFRQRHDVANAFAEVVLGQNVSERPLSERIFDLSRFVASFDLDCPEIADAEILSAKVIECELLLGSFARRVTLRVTREDDIERLAKRYLREALRFRNRAGLNKVVISVLYRLPEHPRRRTLKITILGTNACDIQNEKDRRLREIGLQLLGEWGLQAAVRPPDEEAAGELVPGLLRVLDLGEEVVTGQQLDEIGLKSEPLLSSGFMKRHQRQDQTLSDTEDGMVIHEDFEPGQASETVIDAMTRYRLDVEWCQEFLAGELSSFLDVKDFRILAPDLLSLGILREDGQSIPVFLATRLYDVKAINQLESELRARDGTFPGIILHAGDEAPRFLVENVVISVNSQWTNTEQEAGLGRENLLRRFRAERSVRTGSETAEIIPGGKHTATFMMPRKKPLNLYSTTQIRFFRHLAEAWNSGHPDVHASALIEGTGSRTPREVFTGGRRKLVFDEYVEKSPDKGFWRLKT